MKCIIGLGNIGKEYDNTRHNLGFIALDNICAKYGVKIDKKLKKSIYGETNINGEKVVFLKPTTYMNLSGEAVVEIMNWYKLDKKDILVIYDDVDLPLGAVRYKEKGSAGTHNGMRNIIDNLKTEEFKRLRIGMENRGDVPIPLIDYVLQKLKKEELELLNNETMPKVQEIVQNFLTSK